MGIFFTFYFKKQLKKLLKKYPHVQEDLLGVLEKINLENHISIGHSVYKVRVGSTDQKRGKSGGFRCYIYCYVKKSFLVPLCIYAKSTHESISDLELQWHVDKMNEELVIAIEQNRF